MMDDLKAAFRSLRKSPTFTAVALTVMALGIGSATAIYSVVDAVVLRGLPFDEHDRLAVALEYDTTRPETFGSGTVTPQTYADWRRMQESFESIAVYSPTTYRLDTETGEPADARAHKVSWDFFKTIRVPPILGRTFTAEEEIDGHRVVMLSHGFWQRRFGGTPDVVGKTLELNEASWEIVGVLPRGFAFPVSSDRPSEIGVRMALGASIAWPLSTYFQVKSFLFQVEPTDMAIYVVALGVLAAAGLVASAVPAHRAASIDPLAALCHE